MSGCSLALQQQGNTKHRALPPLPLDIHASSCCHAPIPHLGCVRRRVLRQLKSCNAKTLLNLEWVQKRLPKLKTGVAIIQTRAHVLFGLFLNPRRHKTLVLVWFAGEIPGMYRLAGTAGSNGEPRPVAAVRSQISVLAVRVLSTGRQPGGCNSTLHFG